MPEIPVCIHYRIGDFDGSENIPYCSKYLIRLPAGKYRFSHCIACRRFWHFRRRLEEARFARSPCIHRGEKLGEETDFCCGGIEIREPLYRCELREEPISLKICSDCSAYKTAASTYKEVSSHRQV